MYEELRDNIQQACADQAKQAFMDQAEGRKPLRPVTFDAAVDLFRRVIDQLPPLMMVADLVEELSLPD